MLHARVRLEPEPDVGLLAARSLRDAQLSGEEVGRLASDWTKQGVARPEDGRGQRVRRVAGNGRVRGPTLVLDDLILSPVTPEDGQIAGVGLKDSTDLLAQRKPPREGWRFESVSSKVQREAELEQEGL